MTALADLLASSDAAGVWTVVRDRSTIGFANRTLWGAVNVKGTFSEFSGDGQLTPDGSVFGRVDVTADSLSTGIAKRDEHLRSADFFDVDRYPEISLVVTAAEVTGADRATLRATLTVRGVARPVELPVTVRPLDDGAVRLSTATKIDRTDFGVSGNMIGMLPSTATVSADLVFARSR
jgi:polyisoprenoid-binding protein YceI